MTADLTGKLPPGTRKIRITTNLQVYWDNILIDRTAQTAAREIPFDKLRAGTRPAGESAGLRDDADSKRVRLTPIPLVHADLEFHGYPLKIEGKPPGNVKYVYEKISATGPYTRPAGTYTRYGDVLPLLTATDDKLAVFGSGDEVRLDFDPSSLPALPKGWVRDYFFAANGYEKDMDFYAAEGNFVAPLPFLSMGEYPYHVQEIIPARRRAPELSARIQHAPHVRPRATRILVRLWGAVAPKKLRVFARRIDIDLRKRFNIDNFALPIIQ